MYYAHQHNYFRRPGYQRARQERGAFEKRERSRSGITDIEGTIGDRPPGPPGPQAGIGARTFGEPPRSTFSEPPMRAVGDPPPPPRPIFANLSNDPEPPRPNFNGPPNNRLSDSPRTTFDDPPRTTFSDPPRTTFSDPSRTNFGQPPRSNYENRPISGFSDRERPRSSFGERPRSAFGDRRSVEQERTRRGFFGGALLHSDGSGGEWEGAGARREGEHGTPEMEEKIGWWAWLTRARQNAEQRKRVKAEYEEDMKKMRGRTAIESDYGRY
ncbi:hypothetical protein FRC06_010560 [Ceratobasidium sp. 370]|nr:hypothetical protein FRC06_010560 [Ceratobasidium sp. 370]